MKKILLLITILFLMFPMTANAGDLRGQLENESISGVHDVSNEYVTAEYNENTSTLFISKFADSCFGPDIITEDNRTQFYPWSLEWTYNKIKNIEFGDEVTEIPNYAFCSMGLDSLKFNNVERIGKGAFRYLSIYNLDLGKVTDIAAEAFYSSNLYTTIKFNSGTKIGDKAFYGCRYLTEIYMSGVVQLGVTPFGVDKGAPLITNVYNMHDDYHKPFDSTYEEKWFPMRFVKFQDSGFCTITDYVDKYDIPDSVNEFNNNGYVIISNEYCTAELYPNGNKIRILSYTDAAYGQRPDGWSMAYGNDSIIQEALVGIDSSYSYRNIKIVEFADTVTAIPEYGFKNMVGITTVNLGSNIIEIPTGAFDSCTSLSSIDLSKVTTIRLSAFYDCSSLTSVDLTSCTTIERDSFRTYVEFSSSSNNGLIQNSNVPLNVVCNEDLIDWDKAGMYFEGRNLTINGQDYYYLTDKYANEKAISDAQAAYDEEQRRQQEAMDAIEESIMCNLDTDQDETDFDQIMSDAKKEKAERLRSYGVILTGESTLSIMDTDWDSVIKACKNDDSLSDDTKEEYLATFEEYKKQKKDTEYAESHTAGKQLARRIAIIAVIAVAIIALLNINKISAAIVSAKDKKNRDNASDDGNTE